MSGIADGVDTLDRHPYCRRPIRRNALRSLVEAAHGLPFAQDSQELAGATRGVASYAEELARAADPDSSPAAMPVRDDLRPVVSALLGRLARRAEPELIASLTKAAGAWDQADSFAVIDEDLEAEISATRRRLATAASPSAAPARRAIALEGMLAVDAATALVRLFERRLAALLRLRLRAPTPELLPGGRPFLDLASALQQVAEAWR